MLYTFLSRYLPHTPALVLTSVCYAGLILLVYLVADSPNGEFRYIDL